MKIVLVILALISIIATALPLLKFKKWWIRAFDFPHLQLTVTTCIIFLLLLFFVDYTSIVEITLLLLLIATIVHHWRKIYPYTTFSETQIDSTVVKDKDATIKVYLANVLQDNKDFDTFQNSLKETETDIVVLFETNVWWHEKLQALKDDYPYTVEYPLENYFGIYFLSKLEIKDMEVKFLVDDEIPSIHGKVQLKNGTWIKLYCLHPMHPEPMEDARSVNRDAELLIVAKDIKKEDYPIIVAGDLNDVPWSHTSTLFQKISQLVDPRVGRGLFNSFIVDYPLFRWPLDHLYVSDDFKVTEMRRLKSIGSDHFPIFAEFCHVCAPKDNNKPPKPSKEEKQEAEKTIKEGLEENGK